MKIVFMGTPRAAVPSLERLIGDGHDIAAVYTQPDRPSGRGNKISFSPVKEFALENRLPIHQPAKIKTADALDIFRAHAADVAIVVAYGRILPETFLNAFQYGAVNLHFSLLPKYRGAAPVNWAIVRGETETGVTTMKMDVGLDTGPVLKQQATRIGADETSVDLMARLAGLGADLLSETIASLGTIVPRVQDDTHASYAPMMSREDGLIDWQMTASAIAARVRGFQPFPTAFTYLGPARLAVWTALPFIDETVDDPYPDRRPGTVVEAGGDELLIKCGEDSVLRLRELQPEGKRRMPVRDFLNGVRLEQGTVLGR